MQLKRITSLIFILSLTYSHTKKCKILNGVMDCSGLNFTDCPPGNKSIFTLILDNNLIRNLSSNNCRNWTQLRSLSIRRNGLNNVPGFKHFPSLTKLDLSANQLREIEINSSKNMEDINVSNNSIKTIIINGEANFLKILRASHNQIDKKNLDKLIKSIFQSKQIENLDFSDNLVDSFPVNFMNFKPSQAWSLNLSGNQFTGFHFDTSHNDIHGFTRLNLSRNKITDFSMGKKSIKIEQLDLASNQLSKIDANKLNKFEGLNQLDLLNNPLDCQCNESAAFIQWMKEHANILTNAPQLKCGNPSNQFILNTTCPVSSSTSVPYTGSSTSRSQSSTTANHKTTSDYAVKKDYRWKTAAGILIVIFVAIIFSILFYIYMIRPRRQYQQLNNSNFYNRIINSDCLQMISLNRRPERTPLSVNADDELLYGSEEQHLNCGTSLSIICCSRDTQWIKQEIFSHIQITMQFVDSKMKSLPFSDFIVIIVNGDSCLKDRTFLNNVQLVTQERNYNDTQLLITDLPSHEMLRKNNSPIKYILRKINNNQYFKGDVINRSICIGSLKTWLNLDMVPHNV